MNRPGRGAAWAAATLLGVLLVFAPVVAGRRTLAQGDTARFFAPFRPLVVEALRQGRLPLWNPHEAAGKPLFAEGVHSVLHPVSLAGAWLAPESADFLILGYLMLAALGAFALARGVGATPVAAAGAGLAYALSGYPVSMVGNLVFLAGLSTLPWVVAAARSAGAGWPFGPVATALATACAFFSGDAQVALVGLALGALMAAAAGGVRGALRALGGMAAGALLAGVQLAATRELIPATLRALELSPAEKTRWALAPGRLLEWIVPGLLRGPLEAMPTADTGRWLEPSFAESVYLGAPLLVAAALGALGAPSEGRAGAGGPGRSRQLLAGAAVLLLWLSLGHHLGARQALDWVPVWNRFRYAEKLMAPLTLCLAALGALGVDAFAARRPSRRLGLALGGGALAAFAALLALWLAPAATGGLAADLAGDAGAFHRANLMAGLPHALAGLGALLLADRLRGAAARAGALSLLLALAAALAVPHAAFLGHPDARGSPPLRLEAEAPGPRLIQAGLGHYPAEWGLPYPDANARAAASLLTPSVNVGVRVDALDAYCAFGPWRFMAVDEAFGGLAARRHRRFGLTHVLVPVPPDLPSAAAIAAATAGGRLVERDEALGREVWAVPHRPWAFFADGVEPRAQAREARQALLALVARGDDGTVVVEAPEPVPTAPGRILRVERGTEALWIEAESAGPALLVVQDAYWAGWRASIDGDPTEILAADALVRAVRWPAGRHRLEMRYDPPGVRLGLTLSVVGALLVALLAGLGWRAARAAAGGAAARPEDGPG
jgi:hypothetical protein